MSRPCVCGGSNDNCRYCSGRGEIPDRLATALTAHASLPESRKLHVGARRNLNRRAFPRSAAIKKIESGLRKLRKLRETIFGKVDATLIVNCPRGCNAKLSPQDVQRHIRYSHPETAKRPIADISQEQEYKNCPVCNVRVKARRLERHLRKVHKSRSERSTATAAASFRKGALLDREKFAARRETKQVAIGRGRSISEGKRNPIKSGERAKDAFAEANSFDRRDKTRNYAHNFRENGRYGSHSMHDGFDDESGPE